MGILSKRMLPADDGEIADSGAASARISAGMKLDSMSQAMSGCSRSSWRN